MKIVGITSVHMLLVFSCLLVGGCDDTIQSPASHSVANGDPILNHLLGTYEIVDAFWFPTVQQPPITIQGPQYKTCPDTGTVFILRTDGTFLLRLHGTVLDTAADRQPMRSFSVQWTGTWANLSVQHESDSYYSYWVGSMGLRPDSLPSTLATLWIEDTSVNGIAHDSNRISFGVPLPDGSQIWTDTWYRTWWPAFRTGCS